MMGRIFDIQRNSYVDGPGIRTTVFFKGCNLKCEWCHNPESQAFEKEVMRYQDKCTNCGRCEGVADDDGEFVCLNDARELCGNDLNVDCVMEEILKDKPYYENSCGGVTFSGGECMLQLDFLAELLKLCRKNGVHTAVDTAGCVPWESFEKILPFTDMVLYDIKAMDSAVHKKYTGVDNALILENLARLLKSGVRLWVRVPVIPNVNGNEGQMQMLKSFFDKNGYPEKTELLPYHRMGEHKYSALGRSLKSFSVPEKARLDELGKILK